MDALWLLIALLATWRLSVMLTREEGPFKIMVVARSILYKTKQLSALADCIFCASVWIGLGCTVLVLIPYIRWWLVPFALSGGAILVDGLFRNRTEGNQPPAS
jgi:hypothetical protein